MDRTIAITTWRAVCGSDMIMALPPTGRMLEEFAARIEAAEREAHAQEIEGLRAENDLWKSQVHDEMAANLAFRAAGGALQDEDMPTFCERIIAERDALRARIEGAAVGFWCEAMPAYICLPKNWLEVVKPWTDGKRVALVVVE